VTLASARPAWSNPGMDDAKRASEIRVRAQALRVQGGKLKARAEAMPAGQMREMLTQQAKILIDGASDLDDQALALTPPVGAA
jgi:hypothetical protein